MSILNKREKYHIQIRNNIRSKNDQQKINALDTLLFQSIINELPGSINVITQYLLNNNKQMVMMLKKHLPKVIQKTVGRGYNLFTSLNYICHEVCLAFEEPQVCEYILNTLVPHSMSMQEQFGRELVISPLLKTILYSLRHLNKISQQNFKSIVQIMNMEYDNEREEFKTRLDILHRALALISEDSLVEEQRKIIKLLVESVLISNEKGFAHLCQNLLDSLESEEILDILINLTYFFDKQTLAPLLSSCPIEVSIYYCFSSQFLPTKIKAIRLMQNCLLVNQSLASKFKNLGIINILFKIFEQHPSTLPQILQFLEVFLLDINDNSIISNFIQSDNLLKLIIILMQKHLGLTETAIMTGVRLVISLVNENHQTMEYFSSKCLQLLHVLREDVLSEEVQKVCSMYIDMISSNQFEG